MSTSLLYHGFGIRGYRYERTEYVGGGVVFRLTQPRETCRCAACGSAEVTLRGQIERRFRGLPIGGQRVTLVLPIPRLECRACQAVRQAPVSFAG